MSPEWITAVSSILTALVIAATAIAAVIQLRHMRTGNAIEAILSFRNMLEDDEHRRATALLRDGSLARKLKDPAFRRFLYCGVKKLPAGEVPEEFHAYTQSAIALGNSFELIGTMMRNRIVPTSLFLSNYWWVVESNWTRLEDYVAMMREYSGSQGLFEDFEYLTVLSRKWAAAHPDSYAHGVPKIPLVNKYPLKDQPWLNDLPAE